MLSTVDNVDFINFFQKKFSSYKITMKYEEKKYSNIIYYEVNNKNNYTTKQ